MIRHDFYNNRINEFRKKAEILQKRENRISLARLVTFLSGIMLFFVLISFSVTIAATLLGMSMILFGWLVKYHSATEQQKNFFRHLEIINSRELQSLEGNFNEFPDGSVHICRDHENSYDLDLFGHASLFQFINRTTSKPASDMLAYWLKSPAITEEIALRQQAFIELKPAIEWRQKLNALGYTNTHAGDDPSELVKWARGEEHFANRKRLKTITYALSLFAISSTILVILFSMPAGLLIPVYSINFLFYFSKAKKISVVHNQVTRSSEMLGSYASTIKLIEDENFECLKLKELHAIFTGRELISERIKFLSKLVNRLDTRLNIMVAIPLNLFFFWDIQCCLALEKWKSRHHNDILKWFSGMAEFEVLSCFANMAFNHPDWATPEISKEYFILNAENAGHPLIPAGHRVNNNITISGSGKTVIITGSNMSGKSTFLRTIGVNTVLALAGAPVCASSFSVSHVQVFSSMRISDSLEDNTSSFYAELKRLAAIIKTAETNPRMLLLLDEILRGTNSNDRYTGSVALIKQLIGYQTVAVVATHDLRLAGLADQLPGKIDNYHFDVKIDGEELYFDYRLTSGICTSMNASILMKKMGIKM